MPFSTSLDHINPTQLRGLAWLSLSDSGFRVTQVSTDDSGGGVSQVWTAGTVAIPCRVDPLSGRQHGITGGAIDERSTHVVTIAAGGTVAAQDRFAISGRGTFEVTAVRDRTREWSREFEVVAV